MSHPICNKKILSMAKRVVYLKYEDGLNPQSFYDMSDDFTQQTIIDIILDMIKITQSNGGNVFGGNVFGGNVFGGNVFGGNVFGGNVFGGFVREYLLKRAVDPLCSVGFN